MTKEIEVGEMYNGRVVSIKEFGCFVEVLPGKEGLGPHQRTGGFPRQAHGGRGQDGDMILVKCIGVDEKGRVKFSRRAAMKDRDQEAQREAGAGAGGNGHGASDVPALAGAIDAPHDLI